MRFPWVKRPSRDNLEYTIRSHGGDISLKYFSARETRRGVSAAPFNQRKVFAGTFIRGGRFPNRVTIRMGGHVWKRVGSARHPLEKIKSGVVIPAEMIKGASANAFETTGLAALSRRLSHEISRATNRLMT